MTRATSRSSHSAALDRCMLGHRARARPAAGHRAPPAGLVNALGCVVADLRHDFVKTVNQPVAALDEARVREFSTSSVER